MRRLLASCDTSFVFGRVPKSRRAPSASAALLRVAATMSLDDVKHKKGAFGKRLGMLHACLTALPHLHARAVLMVGAGGIGCELLKTLVLSGFDDIEMARSHCAQPLPAIAHTLTAPAHRRSIWTPSRRAT